MARIEPAEAVAFGLVAVALAVDVPLIREGRMTVSEAARATAVRRAFITVLGLHLLDMLGPLDPFRAAARLIPRRNP